MGTTPDRTARPATSGPVGTDADWADPAARIELPLSNPGELRRFDILLGIVVVVLTVGSVITLLPGPRLVVRSPNLDLVLNTLTAVAAAGAAGLAWIRYRIERENSALFESSGFMILFVTRALLVAVAITGHPERIGLTLDAPQQWPIYGWTLARIGTATLLILGATATLVRSRRLPPGPIVLLELGPAVAIIAILAFLPNVDSSLPPLIGQTGFAALGGNADVLPGMNPAGIVIQGIVALFYLRGAQLYREIYRQRGRQYAGYMSIGLVVAAFSQLHWAILPGIYVGVVTADDLLRATFSVILLLGIDAQSRSDVRALRLANARLHALRSADAERAALEASARLAREVHDGLSQDLWLAKLTQARLAKVPDLPDDARVLNNDIGDAVDRALGGARAVLATMRTGSDGPTVGESLERAVEDFGERSGIKVEFSSSGTTPALPSRTAAELLRIVQEALTNVRKHADATVVRVTATWGRSAFEVLVADNGRGFDPGSIDGSTYGIRGMRERAGIIGGEVEVESRPRDGTRIRLRVPPATKPAPQAASAAKPGRRTKAAPKAAPTVGAPSRSRP
ncbi:MAG TPA: sensor histidine kinase [Candidatus Limnocylindrales bacterium]|nr:sensor histidine kinase [Candidatus Limnocylindrales bacterium]